MKRRWFLGRLGLAGFSLPLAIAAIGGCQQSPNQTDSEDDAMPAARNNKTLVVATSANYPPYEQVGTGADSEQIVGFDIDLVGLIAKRLRRELSVVDLEFDDIIPALVNDEADMAIAALEPTRSRQQQVDFSDVYYRSRQALISLEGYLDPKNLGYSTIAVRSGSVQARFADRLSDDYPNIDVVPYNTLDDMFEALDIGAVEAAILEANVAQMHLESHPNFGLQEIQDDRAVEIAIALPKNSPLLQDINDAIADIQSSGDMSPLIDKWFS